MLFTTRRHGDREIFEKHARLCSKVLTLYVAFGREHAKNLTTETWELWLKLVLGNVLLLFIIKLKNYES